MASSFRIAVIAAAFALISALAVGTRLVDAEPLSPSAADAVPTIASIQPSSAEPGSRITLKIGGGNFLAGAYISFSDPAIHVLATRRTSETELDADIAVGEMAKQQSAVLYVSNPSGTSAQTAFAVGTATTAGSVPQQSQTPSQTASASGLAVTKVDPSQAAAGSKQSVKVTGKNFKEGAKIAFSNPGIRVLATEFKKSTQLIAQIEIAPNAPAGKTSLFVINADGSEVEVAFEVGAGSAANSGTPASSGTTPGSGTAASSGAASGSESPASSGTAAQKGSTSSNAATKQFSVYNLGEATSILQNPDKAAGELGLKGGKLQYEQDGKVVFTAKLTEIQEIAPNVFFGLNTGTFHIILTSGKRYNFVASSLAPADSNSIVESLRSALK
ncbi:MAG TPA: hypothetical protein VFZ27_08155 [Terriglobia bacterium]|nr:hypothetical protein [Terriglobia bacterium]